MFFEMTEEIQAQNEQKNTVGTVGMRFSIIWLILTITLFFIRLGMPLLFLWFILWIIGLFYKPRKRARIAVSIPLVIFIISVCIMCYIWKSIKAPANEFKNWTETELEQLKEENFDEDRFENILQSEINSLVKSKTEEDWRAEYEASTGSNFLEKGSYLFFSLFQQSIENALEKYNNDELLGLDESDGEDDIIDVDVENNDENVDEEILKESQEDVEVFDQSEKSDIEQIIDILE